MNRNLTSSICLAFSYLALRATTYNSIRQTRQVFVQTTSPCLLHYSVFLLVKCNTEACPEKIAKIEIVLQITKRG